MIAGCINQILSTLARYDTHLEPDSGNVTNGVALSTKTSDQDFVIFLNIVEATIPRNERGNFLAILDQLNTNALSNSGIRLLSFDATAERTQEECVTLFCKF